MSWQPTPAGGGAASAAPRLVVVGSGIAGLYAALLAAEAGLDAVLLSKGTLADSNTSHAQGGISAVLDQPAPGDTVAAHIEDTLRAGAGHCNGEAVRIMCSEARQDIAGLRRFGVPFDTGPGGGMALGVEAAHSAPRILHAGGDATGAGIASALIARLLEAVSRGHVRVIARAHVTSLTVDAGRVTGVSYLVDGRRAVLAADAVLLATGGAGQLFAQTTNPAVATADGLALAWRAGAGVADCEFFQFHPTALAPTGEAGSTLAAGHGPLLISEAVRGEGAVLVDCNGRQFLSAYHPDAELAPRDVVSRGIALHVAALGNPAGHVYLDARVIEHARGAGYLERRFPTISRRTREAGIDWTRQPVPVAPAAHYWMGGVSTDLHARTSLPGLYAAGEVACTGVHGANRLASNSLLEGLVFGRRAVADVFRSAGALTGPAPITGAGRMGAGRTPDAAPGPGPLETSFAPSSTFSRDALRSLMTAKAGVIRDGASLREAAAALRAWAAEVRPEVVPPSADPRVHEDANLLLAARLLVAAALERRTGAGAHYRSDSAPAPAAVDSADQRYTPSRKVSLPQ